MASATAEWADADSAIVGANLTGVRELRDAGRFAEALRWIEAIMAGGDEAQDTRSIHAMLLAENDRSGQAVAAVEALLQSDPDRMESHLAAAYIYRLAALPAKALAASRRVLAEDPDNVEAFQYQVFALDDLGASGRAHELARTRPDWFSRDELLYLRGGRVAREVRWGAIATPDPAQRFDTTDRALSMLDEFWSALPDDAEDARARNRRDQVLALRQRERMADAIAAFEVLSETDPALPPYVMQAAADAYLYEQRPAQAAHLYRRVLEHDPWNYNARHALYWALIESENFVEATDLIDAMAAEQPRFRAGRPYWRRLYLDTTAAMARALANQPALAEAMLQALLVDAPASALIRRELGTVYRWRGWPTRALAEAELALAYEPEVVAGRLLHAAALLDLEEYAIAGRNIDTLYLEFPENRHVQRLYEDWRDLRRWYLTSQGEYGSSNGFREFGSRDRRFETRLEAPAIAHHWRPYLTHLHAHARFPEGDAEYDRIGAGVAWRLRRHHAYLEIHRNRKGSADAGWTAGYDFHLNDEWSFATRYERFSTQVPLRARHHGLDGNLAEAAVRWRAHESFNTRLGFSRLSISDGNVRHAALWSAGQRLFAAAHRITEARWYLYGSHASKSGGHYFNPERDASAVLELRHDWLIWRRYERSFTQRFNIASGAYWQRRYGTAWISDLGYEHEWHFSRRFRLRYGVGWSSRVYDGSRERRLHARLGMEVLF